MLSAAANDRRTIVTTPPTPTSIRRIRLAGEEHGGGELTLWGSSEMAAVEPLSDDTSLVRVRDHGLLRATVGI